MDSFWWIFWAVGSVVLFIAVIVGVVVVNRRRQARFAAPETPSVSEPDFDLLDSDFTAGRPGTLAPFDGPQIIDTEIDPGPHTNGR